MLLNSLCLYHVHSNPSWEFIRWFGRVSMFGVCMVNLCALSLHSMWILIAFSFVSAPFPLDTIWGFVSFKDFDRFHLAMQRKSSPANKKNHFLTNSINENNTKSRIGKYFRYSEKWIEKEEFELVAFWNIRIVHVISWNNLKEHWKNQKSKM